MAQIFISYAREDFQHARELYQRLKAQGFRPWMDKVDLLAGQPWQPALERAMRESDFFVLLLSRNSVMKRGFVQREIRTALDLWEDKLADDIFLIPIMLEAMAWEEVPEAISKFQWVELYEDDGWERLAKSLAHGVAQRGIQIKSAAVQRAPKLLVVPLQHAQPQSAHPQSMYSAAPPPVEDVPPVTVVSPSDTSGLLIETFRVAGRETPNPPKAIQTTIVPSLAREFTENLNGVPLEMILVPGGKFLMGSAPDTGYDSERPQHEVIVPAFYCGKFQVTQAQWQAVMGNNLSRFTGDLQRPVEMVSWEDAQAFCKKLSGLTGKAYRPPGEAEWEYACRAGTTGDYAGELEAMAWYYKNAGITTHPVGQKQANKFGLYDMHGNVWEWCEDVWHENYRGAPTDGSAWLSGGGSSLRVLRGGSFNAVGAHVRSASRNWVEPGVRINYVGLRVVVFASTP